MDSLQFKDYPDLLDVSQLCRLLGISSKTAYKLLREGRIGHIRIGRAYRIPKLHLLRLLEVTADEC